MWMVRIALRRPITVMVASIAIALATYLTVVEAPANIFPNLGIPIIYVVQPYAGMAPSQMESLFVTYYEWHFLYVGGIEHIESQSIQGAALLKLYFHPGTDVAQAMAQVTAMTFRATSFMPPGTLPAFILRFDVGSLPVGKLVFSSKTLSEAQVQDAAVYKTRPMLATLPGVSASPPFGGKVRTIVVDLDPGRMQSYGVSPADVVQAILDSNLTLPSGNVPLGDFYAIVQTNAMAHAVKDLANVPLRLGAGPTFFIRDLGQVYDGTDIQTQVALVNGKPTVYMPVIMRAGASTLGVVNAVKAALAKMRAMLPEGVNLDFEFDQSVYVKNAIRDLIFEGATGAFLTGLMVLLFLGSWRSSLIVVITIPLSVMTAFIALRLKGESVNIMTLGGLALAVGILVDEATVAVENVHAHLARGKAIARAVVDGMSEVIEPRFVAVLCIAAVFIPSFFMTGIAGALFPPLALAVLFSMIASYIVSTTVLPVLLVWLLSGKSIREGRSFDRVFDTLRSRYAMMLSRLTVHPLPVVILYLSLVGAGFFAAKKVRIELFPEVDTGQFQLRIRAPSGTDLARTQQIVRSVEDEIRAEVGPKNVHLTLATIGVPNWQYPSNLITLFNSGPQDAVLEVALGSGNRPPLTVIEEHLRKRLKSRFPSVKFSFEAGDIVSRILNFGSPTPVEVVVWGKNFDLLVPYTRRLKDALENIPELRDVQIPESLDYPTVNVNIDRTLAGQLGVTTAKVATSVVDATATSVLISRNYWIDPSTGIPYPVEVRVPPNTLAVDGALRQLPVMQLGAPRPLVSDVASVSIGRTMGEIDHLNNQRCLRVTANIVGGDYGRAAKDVERAIASLGSLPRGVTVEQRGQLQQMLITFASLRTGLILAVAVVLLVLSANFESVRDAFLVVSIVPAVLTGLFLALLLTDTSLNVQSFIGAIMAVGVAVANAVLIVSFAREQRASGESPREAIVHAAQRRIRPILMTTLAMVAGMIPMALGVGAGGAHTAPLGRAVIGGLVASLLATLFFLPSIFVLFTRNRPMVSRSLDPDDTKSSLVNAVR